MENHQDAEPLSPSQPQVSGKLDKEKIHHADTLVTGNQPPVLLSPSIASNLDTQTSDVAKAESHELPASSLLSSPGTVHSDKAVNQTKALDTSLQPSPEGNSPTTLRSDNQLSSDFSKHTRSQQNESTPEVATTEDQFEDYPAGRKDEESLQQQVDTLLAHEKKRIRHLERISRNSGNSDHVRAATRDMAEIVKYFLQSAEKAGRAPLDHFIKFGNRHGEGITVQLRQVYTLFPDKWQYLVRNYEPGVAYTNNSWLEENLMNALVHFMFPENHEDVENNTIFGLSLASCCNRDINSLYQQIANEDYLDYLISYALPDLENFRYETRIFAIPPDTKKLVWFWNFDGTHWVTIVTNINDFQWTHWILDSLDNDKPEVEGVEWGGEVKKNFCIYRKRIETCIRKVSGIQEPMVKYSRVKKGTTPRQDNFNDCGVIAAYNTVIHLKGESVNTEVNGNYLRLFFAQRLLKELQNTLGSLPDEKSEEEDTEEPEVSTKTTDLRSSPTIDNAPVASPEQVNSMSPETSKPPSPFRPSNAITAPPSADCGKVQVEGIESGGNFAKQLEEANRKLVEFRQALPKSRGSSPPATDTFVGSPPRMSSSPTQTKLEEVAVPKSGEAVSKDNSASTPTGNDGVSRPGANVQGSAESFDSMQTSTEPARTSASPKPKESSAPAQPIAMVAAEQQAAAQFRKHSRTPSDPSSPDEQPNKKVNHVGISKDLTKDPSN